MQSPTLNEVAVSVSDARTTPLSFCEDSVGFLRAPSLCVDENVAEAFERSGYENELKRILEEEISALEVVVFDHTVRLDDSSSERRPARNVHADYSEEGARLGWARSWGWATTQPTSGSTSQK